MEMFNYSVKQLPSFSIYQYMTSLVLFIFCPHPFSLTHIILKQIPFNLQLCISQRKRTIFDLSIQSCKMFLIFFMIFSMTNLSINIYTFPPFQGLVWLKDKEATHCKLCEKEFSLSKRKVRVLGRESKSFSANMASNFIQFFFSFFDFSNSTTVETVGKFSVMLALTMNCLCLLHQSQYEFVIPVTHC